MPEFIDLRRLHILGDRLEVQLSLSERSITLQARALVSDADHNPRQVQAARTLDTYMLRGAVAERSAAELIGIVVDRLLRDICNRELSNIIPGITEQVIEHIRNHHTLRPR